MSAQLKHHRLCFLSGQVGATDKMSKNCFSSNVSGAFTDSQKAAQNQIFKVQVITNQPTRQAGVPKENELLAECPGFGTSKTSN